MRRLAATAACLLALAAAPAAAEDVTAAGGAPAPDDSVHHVVGTCPGARCRLNVRGGPSARARRAGVLREGDEVVVVCQARGSLVRGAGLRSRVWDQLEDGGWVTDVHLDTPKPSALPRCPVR